MASCIKIGIIGGSGLNNPDILEEAKELVVDTPFGPPSDCLIVGKIKGIDCVLLARHGRKHTINPSNVNYRANIWALKQQGCTHVITSTACGSLQENIPPGDLVLLDSFIDRTRTRIQTFYDGSTEGLTGVCHIPMEPAFCNETRNIVLEAAAELCIKMHPFGTAVTIEGPRFSSKAESHMFRSWGAHMVTRTGGTGAQMISYKNIPTRSEMQSDDSLDLIDESKLKIVFTHTEQDPTGRTIRPVITDYDPKKGTVRTELGDLVLVKYKCASNHVPTAMTNGSTLPLVDTTSKDAEAGGYNPFEHRRLTHPTTDTETLIHLLKGSLGTGILAMPAAFRNAGLFFGLFATFFIGIICTYCIHILVKCAHKLCRRMKVPSLGFADVAEVAFLAGPPNVQKFASLARFMVNSFLVVDLLGCCCVYIVFVAKNAKQVGDVNLGMDLDLRWYMLALLPLLISMNLIRNLKYLAPFSMVANVLIGTGMGITFYYIFQDLPPVTTRPNFASLHQMPIYFGTAIFALEGIGVVMPLENNMKTPTHFTGCPGVLNTGMFFVVLLYSSVGFFGYLKYGELTEASITLNLPDTLLAQSVKVMIAVAIFLTYSLQFYVPMEIIWKSIKHRFTKHPALVEYTIRTALVVMTVAIAVMVPNLGPFISLVGAVCLSFLGLMFPSIVEIITCYGSDEGFGRGNWLLWKNLAVILFGVVGFCTGSYTSILEIMEDFGKSIH